LAEFTNRMHAFKKLNTILV